MNAIVDHKSFAPSSNADTTVSPFDFKGHQIRVVMIDGEPWFVAADVCCALAMHGWASTYTNRLDALEKTVIRKGRVSSSELETLFGHKQPSLTLISESGLYKLILRSDKPEAKPFQDWVTKEVLPAIRKDGAYVLGQEGAVRHSVHSVPPLGPSGRPRTTIAAR